MLRLSWWHEAARLGALGWRRLNAHLLLWLGRALSAIFGGGAVGLGASVCLWLR